MSSSLREGLATPTGAEDPCPSIVAVAAATVAPSTVATGPPPPSTPLPHPLPLFRRPTRLSDDDLEVRLRFSDDLYLCWRFGEGTRRNLPPLAPWSRDPAISSCSHLCVFQKKCWRGIERCTRKIKWGAEGRKVMEGGRAREGGRLDGGVSVSKLSECREKTKAHR